MGSNKLLDNNQPLACPICEKAPTYAMWEGKYKPEIHQFSCGRCGKAVRGYSKEKAVERWNKFVLSYALCSYGKRKLVNLEDIVDLDAQTKANNKAIRSVIDFMAGERKDNEAN